MANPAIVYEPEADVGAVETTYNLPAKCPGCEQVSAMLVETGAKGSRVTCMGCLRWWVRLGDFEAWV